MKFSLRRLIPFLPLFCNCQLSSVPLLPRSYPGRLTSRNSTPFYAATANFGNPLYNNFALTTQKTQSLYCWEGLFTAPLHSNGSYLIVACVFVAAGMCLPSRFLAMPIYSDFTISAFRRHVTICYVSATTVVSREEKSSVTRRRLIVLQLCHDLHLCQLFSLW
jgi:hypothetical protein